MSIEILAPAGGRQQLIAAVRSGADAVYLGMGAFNARRNAENFADAEALRDAVAYCHGRGVKIHVTMNTLVRDAELPDAARHIEILAACGVDAVIVQDLAVARLFRRHCPSMPLHASTQMTVHNLEGVRAAEELGFSRVVLARELTLDEIRAVCRNTRLEIEVFVHGALCMSVSGQCYLSAMLGERSGNRGLCAQPCRLNFTSGGREYALSLKDMSHITHIAALRDAGVHSLKIEGRMKRPEYVSAAVLACREARDGKTPDLSNLQAVFSRSGFTDGYAAGRRDLSMFGYRTREDVAATDTVLGTLASGYRNELSRVPVSMHLRLSQGQAARLTVFDGVYEAEVSGDVPETARVRGTDQAAAFASLSKTGGTPFLLENLTAELDQTLMLPQSALNTMRREALEQLLEQRSRIVPRDFIPAAHEKTKACKDVTDTLPRLHIRLQKKEQIFDGIEEAERIDLPLHEIDLPLIRRFGDRLVGELPRLTFPAQEAALEKNLLELQAMGLSRVRAGGIGAVRLARRLGFLVHGGFGLHVMNRESLSEAFQLGLTDVQLSFEINLRDAVKIRAGIAEPDRDTTCGIIGYGYLPLMLFRNCPAKGTHGCGECRGQAQITDRIGVKSNISCDNRHYSTLHNAVPLYMGDKPPYGLDFVTLYFTTEPRDECKKIWEKYQAAAFYEGQFTRGLYERKLL